MAELGRVMKQVLLVAGAFAGLAAPTFAAPARVAAPAAAPPRPAIWVIEDEDTKIYLFGTVHVFPSTLRWRSAALDRVIAEADELVMETPEASADDMNVSERLLAPMQLGKSLPILDRVSPRARQPLAAALQATGMPLEYFNQLSTWGVAFLLTGFQMAQGGDEVSEVTGAEEVLGSIFRKSRRPISGVETMEEQVNVFASMPLDGQRRFLESVVVEAEGAGEAEPTDKSWARGDVEAIAAEMQAMAPDLYQALLTRRNRNWTTWLARRMERPGTVLFAVGAGHLAGPDSVQRMLAARGIQAQRID